MVGLLLIDKKRHGETESVFCRRVNIREAAEIMDVDVEHIEWCLEEYNRCDVDHFTVLKEEYDEDHPV